MAERAPALLIANDKSRRGSEIAPFEAALRAGGLEIRRENVDSSEALAAKIREVASEVSCVLLGGGDGTLHAAAPALHETGLPLGILPLGTANDLARSLDIPDTPDAAAAIVLAGRICSIDVGTVNGIPYFNVASLGLSVAVTRQLSGIMKRRLGMLAYPLAAALTIVRYRRFSVALRVDGEEILTRTLQVAVGNGIYYGGGNLVDVNAAIDDGILNVYSLEPRAWWRLLVMARAFRNGEHDRIREVRSLKCRTLSVTTKKPHDVSADGEIVTKTPAEFTVVRNAIRVFVP
jgi:diacylglycerol kinase (ATP)